ncbi:MAG: sulfotransferase [Pseudomonadota bacterium]
MSAQSPKQVYQEALGLLKKGALAPARQRLEAVAKVLPKEPMVHVQLGLIAQKQDRPSDAVRAFSKAHRFAPEVLKYALFLSDALLAAGRVQDAITHLRKTKQSAPKAVIVLAKLGHALQLNGDMAGAEAVLLEAIALAPDDGDLYRVLSVSHRFKDGPLLDQMTALYTKGCATKEGQWALGFALSKAMEDLKAYDRVFSYLQPANEAVRQAYPFDRSMRQSEIDALLAAWEGTEFSQTLPNSPEEKAVFVTGLPRSGTTLFEQILAAHPQTVSIGEPGFAMRRVYRLLQASDGEFAALKDVNAHLPDEVGRGYLEDVKARFKTTKVPIDKSIQTYMVLGAMAQALPQARFVIVERDPRDNLLSIYRNLFAPGTHRYAYDFDDLVFYRRTMLNVVAFWKEQLGKQMITLSYDDLVADPEQQSRALVAGAGLSWDDRCLSFYKTAQTVTSLSVAQVRKPIYQSSTAAWERYGDDVHPLLEALQKDGQI